MRWDHKVGPSYEDKLCVVKRRKEMDYYTIGVNNKKKKKKKKEE